jgi:hypothetical protein
MKTLMVIMVLMGIVYPVLGDSGAGVDSLRYSYSGNLDGLYVNGNVKRMAVITRNSLVLEYGKAELPLGLDYAYGRSNGALNEQEFNLSSAPSYRVGTIKLYGLGEYQHSNMRGIDHRSVYGGGAGYYIMDTRNRKLLLSDMVISERTIYANGTTKELFRNSVRLKAIFSLDKRVKLNSMSYYQPSLRDMADYRWSSVNTLEVKVFKGVSINASYNVNYESIVLKGKAKYNTRAAIGLGYRVGS